MSGRDPNWLVDGSAGHWLGPSRPVKTLWVFARTARGPVRITGRRLDGLGAAQFKKDSSAPAGETLAIADPAKVSVTPGGSGDAMTKAYIFMPAYVFYPSPGCWAFRIQRESVEDGEVTIALR